MHDEISVDRSQTSKMTYVIYIHMLYPTLSVRYDLEGEFKVLHRKGGQGSYLGIAGTARHIEHADRKSLLGVRWTYQGENSRIQGKSCQMKVVHDRSTIPMAPRTSDSIKESQSEQGRT